MDRDFLEGCLRRGMSLDSIGREVGRDPSTVSYWLKKYDLVPSRRAKYAPKGGLSREALVELIDAGATVSEIAARTGRSRSTVRYWLRRFELTTRRSTRLRVTAEARQAGIGQLVLECAKHGTAKHVRRTSGTFRCARCVSEAVSESRRRTKRILVAEAGGKCRVCGYKRSMVALQFHHLDPAQKQFHLSLNGVARSLEASREEARKCILLCANCHAEVEAGDAMIGELAGRFS